MKAFVKKVDEAITAAIGTGSEAEVILRYNHMTSLISFILIQARQVLSTASHSYWLMYPANQHIEKMYEPLWLLRQIFSEIRPWNMIYEAQNSLRELLDRAFFTFEERFVELKVSLLLC
jgi:hypothetical protein